MSKVAFFVFFLLFSSLVIANVEDLEALVKNINNSQATQAPPELPIFKLSNTDYKTIESGGDIFDSIREPNQADNDLQSYNLNQLQMVGYLHYKNVSYAFLRTPYETLKVKNGDKINNGLIISIESSSTLIEETQSQAGKIYKNKIFLTLDQQKSKVLPKLQTQ